MYQKGQKVRMTMNCASGGFKEGDVFTLTADHDRRAIFVDTARATRCRDIGFELIPAITIELGKHYRLRSGKVTGRVAQGDIGFEATVDGSVRVFDKAGGAVFGGGDDIVEAWVPKVGERVRLIKDGKSTTGAVGKSATLVTWDTGTFIDNNDYLLDIDPPVDYRTMSVKENFTRATIDCFEPLLVAAPAQPAVWVPAVGDKVVWLEPFKASMYTKGKEYLIHKKDSYGSLCITDDNDNPNHNWSDDNILRSFALAVPLQIQQGKFYKTRDGRKVGPMSRHNDGWAVGRRGNMWIDTGERYFKIDRGGDSDLIAEWVDEPVAVAASNDNGAPAKPKFKVGDRVVCLDSYAGQFTAGKTYVVSHDHHGRQYESVRVERDDSGSTENGWIPKFFKLADTPTPTAIVALIEDGQPKPAERPFVHATEAAASKEAARLAGLHKGKQFGVYVLSSTAKEDAPTYKHEWQRLAVAGRKIEAIKQVRAANDFLSLRSAKLFVEDFLELAA